MVGAVPVGGDAPITVQTMTNTLTSDAKATIDQIRRCEEAGADLIRVSCPDEASTAAFRQIARAARTICFSAAVDSTSGQDTRMMSTPASSQRRI